MCVVLGMLLLTMLLWQLHNRLREVLGGMLACSAAQPDGRGCTAGWAGRQPLACQPHARQLLRPTMIRQVWPVIATYTIAPHQNCAKSAGAAVDAWEVLSGGRLRKEEGRGRAQHGKCKYSLIALIIIALQRASLPVAASNNRFVCCRLAASAYKPRPAL